MPGAAVPAFPREVADGVHWLSSCLVLGQGAEALHAHNSAFLVRGSNGALLVDTGMPDGWEAIREQLEVALDGTPLTHLFPTHPELPHMGNLGPLLDRHPEARMIGDLRNYHLFYPEHRDRLEHVEGETEVDLGDRTVLLLRAPIHDLPNTLWAFDTRTRTLFSSDAFAYSHPHRSGECTLMSHELGGRPTPEDAAFVIAQALHWPRLVPPGEVLAELEGFLSRLAPTGIAPTHGGFVTEPARLFDIYVEALRRAYAEGAGE